MKVCYVLFLALAAANAWRLEKANAEGTRLAWL